MTLISVVLLLVLVGVGLYLLNRYVGPVIDHKILVIINVVVVIIVIIWLLGIFGLLPLSDIPVRPIR